MTRNRTKPKKKPAKPAKRRIQVGDRVLAPEIQTITGAATGAATVVYIQENNLHFRTKAPAVFLRLDDRADQPPRYNTDAAATYVVPVAFDDSCWEHQLVLIELMPEPDMGLDEICAAQEVYKRLTNG